MKKTRPTFLYDGDCGLCNFWVARWRKQTTDYVNYIPFEERGESFDFLSEKDMKTSPQLIETDGSVYAGAEAVFRLLTHANRKGYWFWMYKTIPGFATLSEKMYKLVSSCKFCSLKISKMIFRK